MQAMARYVRREVSCLSITGIHYFTFSLNELSVHQLSLMYCFQSESDNVVAEFVGR